MRKFKAARLEGLLRLVDMGDLDVLDLLAEAPRVLAAMASQEEAVNYERRRLAWLEQYEVRPDDGDDDEDNFHGAGPSAGTGPGQVHPVR